MGLSGVNVAVANTVNEQTPESPKPDPVGQVILNSATLFRDRREIIIAHGSDNYRLRITSKGKLILTK